MTRDIIILAVIAAAALVFYQFYSVGREVNQEGVAPSSPPPPSLAKSRPPGAGMQAGGGAMEAVVLTQVKEKVFEEEIEKLAAGAEIERYDDYEKTGAVAVVNGEEIAASEFESRLKVRMSMMGAGSPHAGGMVDGANVRNSLLEKMIREKLISQEAERRGIAVSEKDVQDILDERKRNFSSEKEYGEVLRSHNFTERDIRNQLVREMLVDRLKSDITKDVTLTGDDMNGFPDSHGGEEKTR